MKRMRILLIILRNNKDQFIYDPDDAVAKPIPVVQLGLPYIAAVLKQQPGFEVYGINLNEEPGTVKEAIQRYITANPEYDMIFTGGVSLYYHNVKDLIRYIREVTEAKIVLGGGLVSARPELMLTMLRPDYIIRFEGEVTAVELVNAVRDGTDISAVDGITYFRNGEPFSTKPREPIKDLDSIPYPDFDIFGYDKMVKNMKPVYMAYDVHDNPRPYSIIASRGCPFSCTFCFHTIGKGYRQRSVDNIIGEIQYAFNKYHANVIFFNDELFASNKKRMLEICRRIKEESAKVPWKVTFMANMRVDTVDDEALDAVAGAGCNIMGFGLESYSQTVLSSMRKHITPPQIKRAFEGAAKRNCAVQGSFIFGDPAETLETAEETLKFYRENQKHVKNSAQVTFVMVFPGAPIWDDAVKRGIIKDEADFIENHAMATYNRLNPLNITHLSDKDFEILKDRVFTTEYITHNSAIPESIKDGAITVTCPWCGYRQEYRNIDNPMHSFVGCRKCNGRFRLADIWYKPMQRIVSIIGFQLANRIRNLAYALIRRKPVTSTV